MIALLSIDVEEWFHGVPDWDASVWATKRSTLRAEMDRIFGILAETGSGATFFFLDEVAREQPDLVRQVHEAGWEVATHGAGHRPLYELGAEAFADSVRRSTERLCDIAGGPVVGYRAPMWSLDSSCDHAVRTLSEAGFVYDSSLLPGGTEAPVSPFRLRSDGTTILEVPPAPLRTGPFFFPLAGGFSVRLLPGAVARPLLWRSARRTGYIHAYLHPWEISTARRDLSGLSWEKRFFFTAGRKGGADHLRWFCERFRPASLRSSIGALQQRAGAEERSLGQVAGFRVRKDGLFQRSGTNGAG